MQRKIAWSICAVLALAACDGGEEELDAGRDARVIAMDGGSERDAGRDAGREDDPDAGIDEEIDGGETEGDGGSEVDGGSVEEDAGFEGDAGPIVGTIFPPRDVRCAAGAVRPCETSVPVLSDRARAVEIVEVHEDATFTYVFSRLAVPETGTSAVGFNLDGMDSGSGSTAAEATCDEFQPDFSNAIEASHPGTDNAYAGLIGAVESLIEASTCPGGVSAGCIDASLARDIAAGRILLVLEITGVESLVNDLEVEAAIYLVEVEGGGAPELAADGLLASDQTFTTLMAASEVAVGDIFEGRLRVRFDQIMLPAVATIPVLPRRLGEAELRVDLSATEASNGQFGGELASEDLARQAEDVSPGSGDLVRAVLEGIADLRPAPPSGLVCSNVSTGLTFEGVRAVRVP